MTEHAEGLRGDIKIHHLCQHQNDTIIDDRVEDTDAKSDLNHYLDTVLDIQEKEKNNKYILPFLSQQKFLTPFLVSVEGLLVCEAKMTPKQLARCLAEK